MSPTVLVVGGAGYIGSHMVKMLSASGSRVVIFDNLSRGYRDAVLHGDFVEGDLRSKDDLKSLFSGRRFDAVMHFAALCYVGESVQNPRAYYENNVFGTINLLKAMLDAGVTRLVFSSTCATYGVPKSVPIAEDHPQVPVNPYGSTKLIIETMLRDYASAHGLQSISLRYFNAAGCDPDGEIGERHDPETHLIPLVLEEASRVRSGGDPAATKLQVFGDDFDTPDGTCIRDYIHVNDICLGHMAAMNRLLSRTEGCAEFYNLGIGMGFSVKEVIDTCRRVTGVDFGYQVAGRRTGDPPRLISIGEKARSVLDWSPQYQNLEQIIETAWRRRIRESIGR